MMHLVGTAMHHRGGDASYGWETRLDGVLAIWASLGIVRLVSDVSRDVPKGTNTPFGLWVWHCRIGPLDDQPVMTHVCG